ncbi:capping complex subunit for YIEGIA [Desmospora profundinema]|nr:hypothetical protein [Desmospora profundinema]
MLKKQILAVITQDTETVGGGAPIFMVGDAEELERTSFLLERILDGMAHQINSRTMVIVRH